MRFGRAKLTQRKVGTFSDPDNEPLPKRRGIFWLSCTAQNYFVSIFHPAASKNVLPCFPLRVSGNSTGALLSRKFLESRMSEVMQNATKYQSQLESELTTVDDFIRMAEDFMEKGEPSDSVAFLKSSPSSDSNSASQKETVVNWPHSVSSGGGSV